MSKVRDFNLHLPSNPIVADDLTAHRHDIGAFLDILEKDIKAAGVEGGNVMVLDPFLSDDQHRAIERALGAGFCRTTLIDPRDERAFEQIDRLAALGVRGIKFHPYLQNLVDHDFYPAIGVCQYAASRGLWLALCCSYGTKRVYENHAVRLLGALAQARVSMPIIALHTGGRLALEVMSIALDAPNVLLETSYSIPFWVGSSVEQDIAFAIRKVGASRCLFGSDRPYCALPAAINETSVFLRRFGFQDSEVQSIMSENFRRLMSGE